MKSLMMCMAVVLVSGTAFADTNKFTFDCGTLSSAAGQTYMGEPAQETAPTYKFVFTQGSPTTGELIVNDGASEQMNAGSAGLQVGSFSLNNFRATMSFMMGTGASLMVTAADGTDYFKGNCSLVSSVPVKP